MPADAVHMIGFAALRRPRHAAKKALPMVVAVAVAAVAITTTIALVRRAEADGNAQLELVQTQNELSRLQGIPWDRTSPNDIVRKRLRDGERRVWTAIEATGSSDLATVARRNFNALDATFVFARGPRPGAVAAALAARGERTFAPVNARLGGMVDREKRNGRTAQYEAILGSAAAILALLVAFNVIYARAVRSRERLRLALSKLERAQGDRMRLLARTVEAAEAERRRVAADLHDGPIQRLTAVAFTVDLLANKLGRGEQGSAEQLLGQVRGQLSEEMVSLRRLMAELRPPVLDEDGVSAAIADTGGRILDPQIRLAVHDNTDGSRFTPELETVLYRVAREALANVERHAQATRVDVRLDQRDDALRLTVSDDGIGFDPGESIGRDSFGLVTIRERVESLGGDVRVASSAGVGTNVEVTIPAQLETEERRRAVA